MLKATESAAKWLAEKVKSNPKLNPIPYAFFKSIINKQIEWAAKRGVSLDFEELAEAVRAELLKSGIYTMAESGKASKPKHEGTESEAREKFPPLLIKFNSAGDAVAMRLIFDWLHNVFTKAVNERYSALSFSVSVMQKEV